MAHLASALTARLVTREGAEVECAVDAQNGLGVRRLRVDGDRQGRGRRSDLGELLLQLRSRAGQLEALCSGRERKDKELLHGCLRAEGKRIWELQVSVGALSICATLFQ